MAFDIRSSLGNALAGLTRMVNPPPKPLFSQPPSGMVQQMATSSARPQVTSSPTPRPTPTATPTLHERRMKNPVARTIHNIMNPPPQQQLMFRQPDQSPTPTASPRPTATPMPSPTVAPARVANQAFSFQDFAAVAKPIFQKYGIPPQVAFAIAAAETNIGPQRSPTGFAIKRNNFYNIGAFDSNPHNATHYPTPQAGVEAFAKLIAENPRYAAAFGVRNNPQAMLKAIEQAGYAGDPKTYLKRSKTSGGHGQYKSYADFVMNTPEWRNALTY